MRWLRSSPLARLDGDSPAGAGVGWLALAAASALTSALACGREPAPRTEGASTGSAPPASASGAAPASAGSVAAAPSSGPASAGAVAAAPGRTEGCPAGMVRVQGAYCPAVIQECLEHHPEYRANKDSRTVSERCLRFADPTRCVSSERRPMDFCVDRYEWPNVEGELPRVLTSWTEARILCQRAGKRLCTEDEHNFACEGPDMLPHVYGHVRDATKCNIDKEYRQPDQSRQLPTYERCLVTPSCAEELARLDQRHRIGERRTCVSWAGAVDLNGNVNEWVELPGKTYPNRSGLKGGWWGPVRNRCRPTVTFHKEHDYGYEAGFRCCAEAGAPAAPAASAP